MKTSLMIAGVCLMVFTFTIAECGHVISKKQTTPTDSPIDDSCVNVSPDLLDCLNSVASANVTALCSSHCRSALLVYYERCSEAYFESLRQAINILCDNPDIMIPDSCQLNNLDSNLRGCINSFDNVNSSGDSSGYGSVYGSGHGSGVGSGESLACTSECRSELEDYYERCTDGATLESFRGDYNALCGIGSCTNIPDDVADCNSIPEACTSTCRSVLEGYIVRCLPEELENFRESYNSVCAIPDMPDNDDSCQNITSDLQECIDGFDSRNTTVTCSSYCRSTLEGHYEMCFETGLEAFRQSYSFLCDSPSIDNCQNITTGLEQCLDNFTSGDISACTSTCRSQLEGYFEMCVPGSFEAFMQAYSSLCDMPSPNGSCQITPILQDCFDSVASDPTVMCTSRCWPELAGYYESCLGDVALASLREVYSSICNIPDVPGIDDSCLLSNMNKNFTDCINSLGGITSATTDGSSPACSSECRYDIEDYVERCLDTAVARAFVNVYNAVCAEPSSESGPSIDVQLSGSGVVVTVEAAGAESIRIILRDSSNRRHTQSVTGSSASVEFPDLPSGLTSVRANVKLTSGKRLSTKFEEIIIPN